MKRSILPLLLLACAMFGLTQAQTVRLASGLMGGVDELTHQLAQMYMEENPGVTIEIVSLPNTSRGRLTKYSELFDEESGNVDVFQLDIVWPSQLAEHLINLYDYEGVADIAEQHSSAMIEANTVGDALVAIPWFADPGLLYYRTDLLQKYDYEGPPQTWLELEEMSQTIQEGESQSNPDFKAFVWHGKAYEGLTCIALEWISSAGGGRIISPGLESVITIDNVQAAKMVSRAAGWVGTISPMSVVGFEEEDARRFFQTGDAAFMRNWPYAYDAMRGNDSPVAKKFDVAPLPRGENGRSVATLGGWSLGVSKYSANPELAVDVAKFMTSKNAQKFRAVESNRLPTLPSLYKDSEVLEANPFFSAISYVLDDAVIRPSVAAGDQYDEVSRMFYKAVHSVLVGNEQANEALEILEFDLHDLTGLRTEPSQAKSSSTR